MIRTNAKSKISIGSTTEFTTAVAYAGDTYKLISNVEDMGEAGSEATVVVGKYTDQDYARKLKGQRDNGSIELVVARDSADLGYQALVAAEQTDFGYNFKIQLNDAPAQGSSPKPSIFYFNAIVASRKNALKGPDDIITTTFTLAISGAIIEVPASAT